MLTVTKQTRCALVILCDLNDVIQCRGGTSDSPSALQSHKTLTDKEHLILEASEF